MLCGTGLERRAGERRRQPTSDAVRRTRHTTSEERDKGATLRAGLRVVEIDGQQGRPTRDEERIHQRAQGMP